MINKHFSTIKQYKLIKKRITLCACARVHVFRVQILLHLKNYQKIKESYDFFQLNIKNKSSIYRLII